MQNMLLKLEDLSRHLQGEGSDSFQLVVSTKLLDYFTKHMLLTSTKLASFASIPISVSPYLEQGCWCLFTMKSGSAKCVMMGKIDV